MKKLTNWIAPLVISGVATTAIIVGSYSPQDETVALRQAVIKNKNRIIEVKAELKEANATIKLLLKELNKQGVEVSVIRDDGRTIIVSEESSPPRENPKPAPKPKPDPKPSPKPSPTPSPSPSSILCPPVCIRLSVISLERRGPVDLWLFLGVITMFVSSFVPSIRRVALFNLAWAFVLLSFLWEVRV